jgi:hypothetical protein
VFITPTSNLVVRAPVVGAVGAVGVVVGAGAAGVVGVLTGAVGAVGVLTGAVVVPVVVVDVPLAGVLVVVVVGAVGAVGVVVGAGAAGVVGVLTGAVGAVLCLRWLGCAEATWASMRGQVIVTAGLIRAWETLAATRYSIVLPAAAAGANFVPVTTRREVFT